MFCRFEKNYYLCTRKRKMTESGALVQLVRMPACHAGGHEFESRTHRLVIHKCSTYWCVSSVG